MTGQPKFPTYEQIAQAIISAKTEIDDPAELHGLLAGMICARAGTEELKAENLDMIDEGLSREFSKNEILLELFKQTSNQLHDVLFSFRLLLPNEKIALKTRAESLSRWCNGYLEGLGLGGLQMKENNNEIQEALQSLAEIARLDFEKIETTENDEVAFTEAAEFVRLAVLTVFNEVFEMNAGDDGIKERTIH
jgi:uncharacterized protein YgfB (UPF0149 family)